MHQITPFIQNARAIIDTHNLGDTGAYRRWNWQNAAGNRELGVNEYGCADAANILYMIGQFPSQPQQRAAWIGQLQALQNPQTGLFTEATHHTYHTTAHCIAALELFDAQPLYPLTAMKPLLEKEQLYALLDGLDWAGDPWVMSHQGAGIFAAMVLAEPQADLAWRKLYFDWLWENADPQTGFWRKGAVKPLCHGDSFTGVLAEPTIFPHLAGSFHYLFNHEYAHMPLHYPDKMIDSCLELFHKKQWPTLGRAISFAEIDWVYCLTRASRQTPHRFEEIKQALRDFADAYIPWLLSLDPATHDGLNDLHTLFGCICALAELQSALPGDIASEKPLKLVLDRRPFI